MLFFRLNQYEDMLKNFLLVIAVSFHLTSCGNSSPRKTNERILSLNFTQSPLTLDPRKSGETISSTFIFMMFEGLTKITPESSTNLGLADKIQVSHDFMTYTFHLRDAYWSNGDPITSEDFAYSWKSLLEPVFPSPNAHLLFPIKNAQAIKKGLLPPNSLGIACPDEKTLIVHLEKPTPFFLELTSFCTYFPINHKVANTFPQWAGSLPHFVVSGPFIFSQWKKDVEAIIVPNPYYYKKERVQLDGIRITFIQDDLVASAMYQRGDIDITGACFSQIPIEMMNDKELSHELRFTPINSTIFCCFNLSKSPFNNLSIRKALSLAVNKKEVISVIAQKESAFAQQIIPPCLKWNDDTPYFEDYNIGKAKEYFEQGLQELQMTKRDFPKFRFICRNTPNDRKLAQAIQEQWRKNLDIEVQLENVDLKTFIDKLINRNYDVAQAAWIAQYLDPMDIFNRFRFKNNPKNYCNWENSQFQEILDLSEKTTDLCLRKQLLQKAEKVFADDMPISCICHYEYMYLVQDRVKNFYISPLGSIHLDFISIKEN